MFGNQMSSKLVGLVMAAGITATASSQNVWSTSQGSSNESSTSVVEFTDRDGTTGRIERSGGTVMIEFRDTDGARYVIDLDDGNVVTLKRNGREMDVEKRTRVEDDEVILLGPSGRELRRFGLPGLDGQRTFGIVTRNNEFPGALLERAAEGFEFASVIDAPPVMLGVTLGDAGGALRAHLGLGEDEPAILIESVIEGLPADKAGLEKYDVVVGTDAGEIEGATLTPILRELEPGDVLELDVIRRGRARTVTVELEAYDGEALGVQLSSRVLTGLPLAAVQMDQRARGGAVAGAANNQFLDAQKLLSESNVTKSRARLAAQLAQLDASAARLRATEERFARAHQQLNEGLISRDTLANMEAEVAEARAKLASSEADLAAAQAEFEVAGQYHTWNQMSGFVFEDGKLTRIPGAGDASARAQELERRLVELEARLKDVQRSAASRLEELIKRLERKLDDVDGE